MPVNSAGSTAFHSTMTTAPRTANATRTSATMPTTLAFDLIWPPSKFKFVIDRLQTFAQKQHRIALAGEQGIHGHPAVGRHLPETAALEFMRHEDLALAVRQRIQRALQC